MATAMMQTLQPRPKPAPEGPALFDSPLSIRDRIVLRGLHSSGGIGEVWVAYDEVLGREIALKRLNHDKADSARARARFFREAQLTGQLEHPGVVPVYDYNASEDGRQRFYTMRFLRGRTFDEVIADFHAARRQRGVALVSSAFLELLAHFTSVCNTLAFAHSRGVIHRDLKGENVMIGDFGEVVVLDWGLAKRLDDDTPLPEDELADGSRSPAEPDDVTRTMHGELLGTPAYMAPEQALGLIGAVDRRTDVYGLAALLYEVLTGEPPFDGAKIEEVMKAVIDTPPVAPSERVPGIPAELERVCMRGLAKDRDERPQSAVELAAEVRGWLTALAERRRMDQERERFFDLSVDLLAIVDREGRICQSNVAWETLLGWPARARADRAFAELVEEEHRAAAAQARAEVLAGGERAELEIRMRAADGSPRWINWNLRSIPEEDAVYLVGRDVSERKRSEQELEGLLESAPDATCVIDEGGTIVRVNAQLERMFGYPRAELLGESVELLVPTPLRGRHGEHVRRYLASPRTRPMGAGLSLQGQTKTGEVFAVEISLSPVPTEQRLLIACTLRDASARRKLERQTMAVLAAAPDAMIVVDREQSITLVNRQTEELFGYAQDELLGRHFELLIPEPVRERHREQMRRLLADPSPRLRGAGWRLLVRRRDGSELAVEISLSPVTSDDGLLICAAIRPAEPERSEG